MTENGPNPMLLRLLQSAIAHATGRRYQIDLDRLDDGSLRELLRLLRDLESERISAVNRARLQFWKRP